MYHKNMNLRMRNNPFLLIQSYYTKNDDNLQQKASYDMCVILPHYTYIHDNLR
jgi:hypothetical protein